jgi:predicted membrane channel-forming protein YqfA (hemolysin III family)
MSREANSGRTTAACAVKHGTGSWPDAIGRGYNHATMEQTHDPRGVGGTPGGVWEFVIGLVLAAVGGYLLLNQVQVTTSFWHFWGANTFGLTLLPLLVGIGILFYSGRSIAGWLLVIVGLAIIVAGILMNMDIYFRSTSLFNTLVMLALLAGGLGLVARSLRPHPRQS